MPDIATERVYNRMKSDIVAVIPYAIVKII